MTTPLKNLFELMPNARADEQFSTLLDTGRFKLARIVSTGQSTPEGDWYDQERAEWVVVLKGRAGLQFEDEAKERTLEEGDFVHIAPHRRHRVTWTASDNPTVWLALYYDV